MKDNVATKKLVEIAKTIRSKNAGVDKITFDIIFRDRADYDLVRNSGALTRETVAALYGIEDDRISDFVEFDPAFAIKFTIYRERPSGSPGDPDIFGAQQYAPLMEVEIPIPKKQRDNSQGGGLGGKRPGQNNPSISRSQTAS